MRIMSWNIRDGGACGKIENVLQSIEKHNPDIVVLTEYISNRRELLETRLRGMGFSNVFMTTPPGYSYGVVIASKMRCKDIVYDYEPPNMEYRWKEVYLPDSEIRLLAVSVPEAGEPGRDISRKQFLSTLSNYCDFRRLIGDRVIVMGDFSSEAIDDYRDIDKTDTFHRAIEMGWRDPWQEQNKGFQEFSYFPAGKTGPGCRSDRVLLSPKMGKFDTDYRYLHLEREQGISDHSIQMLEVSFTESLSPLAQEAVHQQPSKAGASNYPFMLGYGKSMALYWTMTEKASDMLRQFGDYCLRPVVWFNPSFSLGGKGSNAVGYFDGIIMGDSKILQIKGEWNGVGPIYDEINIDTKTLERHEVLRWYIANWKLGYSWDYFVRDMGDLYNQHFGKKIPAPDRIMARKLEKMMNKIHSHIEGIEDKDIIDVLLYINWVREDEGVPDTKVFPDSFELIRYMYPDEEEGPYIVMPMPR